MSEVARAIDGEDSAVTSVEFFGTTFEERRLAVQKIETFRNLAERALLDTVMLQTGDEVSMTFRPSSVSIREYNFSFPCYSLFDAERKPVEKNVTIREVDEANKRVRVTAGELINDRYEQQWSVRLHNIIAILPVDEY